MNVPKLLRFEIDSGTVLKILNVLYILYTDCSRAYRILRHILYHSTAKSEKETIVNWQRDGEAVWSR